MSWTDERVSLLRKMWVEGKTAAEIAKELGGVTRNAVIGKAHRLKLSNRVSPIQQNKKPVAPAKPPVEKKIEKILLQDNSKPGIDLLDLKNSMCCWPKGDPRDENFGFCGEEAIIGRPSLLQRTLQGRLSGCDQKPGSASRGFRGKSRQILR